VVVAFLARLWTPIGSNRFIDPGFVVANQISIGLSNQPIVAGIVSIQEIDSIPAFFVTDIVSSVYSLLVIICRLVVVELGPAVGNDNALVNRERHEEKQCPNCRLSRHGAMPSCSLAVAVLLLFLLFVVLDRLHHTERRETRMRRRSIEMILLEIKNFAMAHVVAHVAYHTKYSFLNIIKCSPCVFVWDFGAQ